MFGVLLTYKKLGDYHHLYMCCIFKTFTDMCLKTYDFGPTHFSSATRLAWIAVLKRQI